MTQSVGKLEDIGPALLGASLGVFLAKLGELSSGAQIGSLAFLGAVIMSLVIFASYQVGIALRARSRVDPMIAAFGVYIVTCAAFAWQFGGGEIIPIPGEVPGVRLGQPSIVLIVTFPIIWHLILSMAKKAMEA